MRTLAACSLFLICLAEDAASQQLQGKLREEGTNMPVAAALVLLMDSTGTIRHQAFSDTVGAFTVTASTAGTHWLAIERIGYVTVHSRPILLVENELSRLQLSLSPQAVRLDSLIVRERAPSRVDRFYENRRRFGKLGIGDFLGRDDLAQRNNQPLSSILQSIPYLNAVSGSMMRLNRGRPCQISYYIDGVRLRSTFGQSVDYLVRVEDLEGIETYRGQSQLPPEYADAQSRGCPVVAFWTRRTS
jgi:hypothetical protein